MYKLYQDSKICYVYLQDAPTPAYQRDARNAKLSLLRDCRWAKRGWTLQELIAPTTVHFYSDDWTYQGQRSSSYFAEALSEVTGIEVGVLTGQVMAAKVSVANRMRWASKRQTTRPEDIAYCLMGLFGVNMPLLYGEGASRAFIRLQEQILKVNDDQSIFAWELPRGEKGGDMHGLLAESPSYFSSDRSIYTMSIGFQSMTSIPWSMTNKGLQVQLFDCPDPDGVADQYLAVLDCFLDQGQSDNREELSPAIYLRRLWGDQYTRVQAHICLSVGERTRATGSHHSFFVKQDPAFVLPDVGIAPHLLAMHRMNNLDLWTIQGVYPENLSNLSDGGTFQLSLSQVRGIQGIFRFCKQQDGSGMHELVDVAVVLHRTVRAGLEAVCFPRPVGGNSLKEVYNTLNRKWTGSPLENQDQIVGELRDQSSVAVEMTKAVRSGRGLYILDLHDTPVRVPLTNLLPNLYGGSSSEAETAKQTRAALSDNVRKAGVEDDLQRLLDPMHPSPSTRSSSFCSRLEAGIRDTKLAINPAVKIFCQAILDGDESEVARLLRNIDVTRINSRLSTFEGLRALHFTSLTLKNQSNVVSILLRKGAEPRAETERGLTTLHLASVFANSGVLRPMLQSAPENEFEDGLFREKSLSKFRSYFGSTKGSANTALHLAAVYCSAQEFENIVLEIFRSTDIDLMEWSVSEVREEREYLFGLQNSRGQTVFQTAAAAGNLGVVQLICQTAPGAITHADSMGRRSLWYAAYGEQVMAAEILKMVVLTCSQMRFDVSPDTSDNHGLSPLHVACWRGNMECVKELLHLGAACWTQTMKVGLTPIHYAALFGHWGCLQVMVDFDWPKAQRELNKQPAINMTARNGSSDLFQPIHLAAANGWLDCVVILARNGALTTTRMPCYYALSRNATESQPERPFKGLVEVDPSTPEEMAAREGYTAVADFLRNYIPLTSVPLN